MKLVVHCGRPRAELLVEKWIVALVKTCPFPVSGIAFWCDVGMRLSGLQLSECEPYVTLSASDRAHYDTMLKRVGMKVKRGSVDSVRRAVGAPSPTNA